jgi:hypothetical protein
MGLRYEIHNIKRVAVVFLNFLCKELLIHRTAPRLFEMTRLVDPSYKDAPAGLAHLKHVGPFAR